MEKIVLVTGGFDPLHSGHIAYFKAAKEAGNKLVVGVNSDEWLTRKKGRPFMPYDERIAIIKELSCVDEVVEFDDTDNTAVGAIRQVMSNFPNSQIIFANGGDRQKGTTPEVEYAKEFIEEGKISFLFGIGGDDKKNSSSWILDEWKTQKTERDWGYWRVLDDKQPVEPTKVKELVIYPGKSLSDQKHAYRDEHWYVLSGQIEIDMEFVDGFKSSIELYEHNTHVIPVDTWHKTTNTGETPAHIIEIQYGDKCEEDDIERR